MNIKLVVEPMVCHDIHGGEYAVDNLIIYIDSNLSYEGKVERIIHACIDNYCRNWSHDNVDELTSIIYQTTLMLDRLDD